MFKLYFATPDRKILWDVELEEITLPAHAGELNIIPGHAPLMTTLEAGLLNYKLKNGACCELAISWGYCQVATDGVTVIVEVAMQKQEIDSAQVQKDLEQEENRLASEFLDDAQWKQSNREVAWLRAEKTLFSR